MGNIGFNVFKISVDVSVAGYILSFLCIGTANIYHCENMSSVLEQMRRIEKNDEKRITTQVRRGCVSV